MTRRRGFRLPRLPVPRGWRQVAALAALAAIAAPALAILVLRWLPPPTTAFMLLHEGEPRHRWVAWPEISPHVAVAVLASEDQKFPHHHGFDFASISSALSGDERRRLQIRRGASTISQQVAKNLFLWPGRSLLRKGLEAGLTLWIEALWPKRRILEVYLNIAEFGPGIFGVGAASAAYFGASPGQLGPYEAARLAAVLPDPRRLHVVDPGPYALERAAWIREQVAMLGGPAYLRGL
jgi:monofunctional biosynthetic peptidoglycan transglycosylase